jgi:hypothetical protein
MEQVESMAKASALRDLTVAQLEKLLQAKKSKLEDLVVKRDKLRTELSNLDQQIRGLGGEESPEGEDAPRRRGRPKGSKNKARRGTRVKGQKSLKVWVHEELLKAKKGLTIDELIAAVEAAGYKSKADKFKNVMYQCLFHGQRNSLYQRDAETKRWTLTAQ